MYGAERSHRSVLAQAVQTIPMLSASLPRTECAPCTRDVLQFFGDSLCGAPTIPVEPSGPSVPIAPGTRHLGRQPHRPRSGLDLPAGDSRHTPTDLRD